MMRLRNTAYNNHDLNLIIPVSESPMTIRIWQKSVPDTDLKVPSTYQCLHPASISLPVSLMKRRILLASEETSPGCTVAFRMRNGCLSAVCVKCRGIVSKSAKDLGFFGWPFNAILLRWMARERVLGAFINATDPGELFSKVAAISPEKMYIKFTFKTYVNCFLSLLFQDNTVCCTAIIC
jgi:hypothetical protein